MMPISKKAGKIDGLIKLFVMLVIVIGIVTVIAFTLEHHVKTSIRPGLSRHLCGYQGAPFTVIRNYGDYAVIRFSLKSVKYECELGDITYEDESATVHINITENESSGEGGIIFYTCIIPLENRVAEVKLETDNEGAVY